MVHTRWAENIIAATISLEFAKLEFARKRGKKRPAGKVIPLGDL
jgi:hypothetical protein